MLQKEGTPFIRINNIGSRSDGCTIFNLKNGLFVRSGCWFGTIDDFIKAVEEKHGDNKFAKQYLLAVKLAKVSFS
jgi:hypothetical protein